jgi:hypothetical protein
MRGAASWRTPLEELAGPCSGGFALGIDHRAIDHDMRNASGERSGIADHSVIGDGGGIEQHQIGLVAGLEQPPARDAELLCRAIVVVVAVLQRARADAADQADSLMDMLLAKKRAADRREWLEEKGNLAQVIV